MYTVHYGTYNKTTVYRSPISVTLNDFELISQLNAFSDTNIANAIIQKIENNLDYINLRLAIFDKIIPLRNL